MPPKRNYEDESPYVGDDFDYDDADIDDIAGDDVDDDLDGPDGLDPAELPKVDGAEGAEGGDDAEGDESKGVEGGAEEEADIIPVDSWETKAARHDPRAPRIYNFVEPDQRRTSQRVTKYEFAEIIACRAAHLENGAPPYIDDAMQFTSSIAIAYTEMMRRRIPFVIYRHVGDMVERWRLAELVIGNVPSLEEMTSV